MTNQNNAAQPAEQEAVRRALELYAGCYDTMTRIARREGREPVVSPVSVAFDIRKNMVDSVVEVLSKLRAEGVPVAGMPEYITDNRYHIQYRLGWNNCLSDCRAAMLNAAPVASAPADERALTAQQRKEFIRRASFISEADRDTRAAFVDEIARAALASAPVAHQDAASLIEKIADSIIDNFRDAGWSMPSIDSARVREAVKTAMLHNDGQTSAPVAGNAVAWVTDTAGATDDPKLAEAWRKVGWPVRPLVYGDAAPQASEAADTLTIDLDYADGASVQIEVHGTERMLRRLEAWLGGERSRIREQSRNAALEEAAGLVGGCTWAGSSKMVSALIAEHIRALKSQPQADQDGCTCPSGDGSLRHPCPMHPGADKDGGQQRAMDSEEFRSRVLSAIHDVADLKPEDDETWEEWYCAAFDLLGSRVGDIFRAALSATQTEQGERD